MNTSFAIDLGTFIVALVATIYIFPHCDQLFKSKYLSYLLTRRILKMIGHDEDSSTDDDTRGDIGLSSHKKTLLDNVYIKNFIASNNERVDKIKNLLLKSGKREEEDFTNFIVYNCIVFGMVMSVFCYYVINVYIINNMPFNLDIIISIPIGLFIGYHISMIHIQGKATERQVTIDEGVPDLIDLLVICTESGLDLNRSITRIAREMRNSNIELSDELTLTAIEIEMIPDFKQVFLNMENRTDSQQVKSLAKTLSQSIEYGSPLGEMLKELAMEARQKKMLIAEERAARIPTLLTLPLMIFILPCLFIVMLGPVISEVIKSFG